MYNKNFYVVCYKRRVYKFKKHPEIFNIFLMNHQWMTQITLIPSTRGPILMFADYAQSQEGFTRLGPLKTNIPQSVLVFSV